MVWWSMPLAAAITGGLGLGMSVYQTIQAGI